MRKAIWSMIVVMSDCHRFKTFWSMISISELEDVGCSFCIRAKVAHSTKILAYRSISFKLLLWNAPAWNPLSCETSQYLRSSSIVKGFKSTYSCESRPRSSTNFVVSSWWPVALSTLYHQLLRNFQSPCVNSLFSSVGASQKGLNVRNSVFTSKLMKLNYTHSSHIRWKR